jgi:hypothetical protein
MQDEITSSIFAVPGAIPLMKHTSLRVGKKEKEFCQNVMNNINNFGTFSETETI